MCHDDFVGNTFVGKTALEQMPENTIFQVSNVFCAFLEIDVGNAGELLGNLLEDIVDGNRSGNSRFLDRNLQSVLYDRVVEQEEMGGKNECMLFVSFLGSQLLGAQDVGACLFDSRTEFLYFCFRRLGPSCSNIFGKLVSPTKDHHTGGNAG